MIEQGTQEWFEARCGVITASRFKDVMSKGQSGKPSKTRQTYMNLIAAERMTGLSQDSYSNAAMAWGTRNEPLAVAAYEWEFNVDVERTGFIPHPDYPFCGASPDGLLDGGGLELKCPYSSAVHMTNIINGEVPTEYMPQVQGGMFVTGREWWDFGSFDPRMPLKAQLNVIRVKRDDEYIKKLCAAIVQFNDDCNEMIERLLK